LKARVGGPSQTFAPVYQIDARGADSGTVVRIQRVLDQHTRAIAEQQKSSLSAKRYDLTGVS